MDTVLFSETKLDDSFLLVQIKIDESIASFRFDRSSKGDGVLTCMRENIPSRQLFCKLQCNIETMLH